MALTSYTPHQLWMYSALELVLCSLALTAVVLDGLSDQTWELFSEGSLKQSKRLISSPSFLIHCWFFIVLYPSTKIRGLSHLLPIQTTLILRQRLVCPSDTFPTTSTGLFLFHKVYFPAVLHPLFLPCKFCYSYMFCCTLFVKLYHKPPFIPLWLYIIYVFLLNFVTKYYTMSLVNLF